MEESNKKVMINSIDFEELDRLHKAAFFRYGVDRDKKKIAKALQQKGMNPAPLQRVIDLANVMLRACGYSPVVDPVVSGAKLERLLDVRDEPNANRDRTYRDELGVDSQLVWMKFAQSGHLGVVAASNDINFDAYDGPRRIKSDMLVKACGSTWDASFVLAFPLIKAGEDRARHRNDVEALVGNYLIANGVPVIDYYSHNY